MFNYGIIIVAIGVLAFLISPGREYKFTKNGRAESVVVSDNFLCYIRHRAGRKHTLFSDPDAPGGDEKYWLVKKSEEKDKNDKS